MASSTMRKLLTGLGLLLALWLAGRYVLPIIMPFLLGALVALAAEPAVSFGQKKLKLPRGWAAGLGVTVTLVLLAVLISMLGALVLRELVDLAASAPDLRQTAQKSMTVLEDWLVDLAGHAPDSLSPVLTRTVVRTFDSGDALMEQVSARLPGFLTGLLSGVPNGALSVFTGLLAAFMISARLPRLRRGLWDLLPDSFRQTYLPALKKARKALGGWLRAQGLLALVTYAIVALGFLLLRVPYGLFWALLIALMDAVPMLGTGLVLVPWATVSLLQGRQAQALGLVGIFVLATVARSTLEPKLVGKQLGLDPLATLLALYTGYRLWGFWGLLAAPILTATVKTLAQSRT